MTIVFIAAILVGIVVFKQDWETQAREAEGFMGGKSNVSTCAHVAGVNELTMSR